MPHATCGAVWYFQLSCHGRRYTSKGCTCHAGWQHAPPASCHEPRCVAAARHTTTSTLWQLWRKQQRLLHQPKPNQRRNATTRTQPLRVGLRVPRSRLRSISLGAPKQSTDNHVGHADNERDEADIICPDQAPQRCLCCSSHPSRTIRACQAQRGCGCGVHRGPCQS